ncbi:DNA-binding protein [Pseudomonas sp. WN033]|nr:DNA-binding protein [Pseudomonas sp. WN033]
MGFFNLGKKDRYGNQARIEHRGKHLRVSRTGGVSLRAQAKAAGMNVTANSKHGLRVSGRVVKGTQMAMQNGRFVLRGRYGSGPTKLNMSKSGFTVSSRNELGTFNWIKPNRSSAKVFGVQMRGRKAANAQMAFMFLSLVAVAASEAFRLMVFLLVWAWRLLVMGWQLLMLIPYGWEQLKRNITSWRIQRMRNQLPGDLLDTLGSWDATRLVAALALAAHGWGRGQLLSRARDELEAQLSIQGDSLVQAASDQLVQVEKALDSGNACVDGKKQPSAQLAIVAELGKLLRRSYHQNPTAELLLQLDELLVRLGPKTRFQEQMLAVLGDAFDLRLVESEVASLANP